MYLLSLLTSSFLGWSCHIPLFYILVKAARHKCSTSLTQRRGSMLLFMFKRITVGITSYSCLLMLDCFMYPFSENVPKLRAQIAIYRLKTLTPSTLQKFTYIAYMEFFLNPTNVDDALVPSILTMVTLQTSAPAFWRDTAPVSATQVWRREIWAPERISGICHRHTRNLDILAMAMKCNIRQLGKPKYFDPDGAIIAFCPISSCRSCHIMVGFGVFYWLTLPAKPLEVFHEEKWFNQNTNPSKAFPTIYNNS